MDAGITLGIHIEELVLAYPRAVRFLAKKGVRCIRCGEPVWGTLRELLREDGIDNPEQLVDDLNAFLVDRIKE